MNEGRHKTWNFEIEKLDEQLDYLEKEGWEIVSVLPDVYQQMDDYEEAVELKSVYVTGKMK